MLVVELRDLAVIKYISTRAEADDQIRRRIFDLAENCPLDILHAVSALGTRLCFYNLDVKSRAAKIDPPKIACDPIL